MSREQSGSFTVSLKEETITELLNEEYGKKIQNENLIYLYGKWSKARFLT